MPPITDSNILSTTGYKDFGKLKIVKGVPLEQAVQEGHEFIVDISPVGRGKTERLTNLISNSQKSFLVLAESHQILTELENRLISRIDADDIAHWKGFAKLCPLYEIFRGLKPQIACQICHKFKLIDSCPYHNQFDKHRIVLAPYDYVWLRTIDNIEPDIVIVEENIFKSKNVARPEIEKLHQQAEFGGIRFRDLFDFIDKAELIERAIVRKIVNTAESVEQATNMAKEYLNPPPSEFALYLETIYKTGLDETKMPYIAYPYVFPLFEYARRKGAQVICTDGTFSLAMWKAIHLRAFWEDQHLPVPYVIKYDFEAKPPSVVFTYRNYKYAKETLKDPRKLINLAHNIALVIHQFRKEILILNKSVIPLITYKDIEEPLSLAILANLNNLLPDSLKNKFSIRTLHFGDTRSINVFAEYRIGFIVGTYTIGHNNFSNTIKPLIFLSPDSNPTKNHNFDIYHYDDTFWEELRQAIEDVENYQALGRFRLDNFEGIPKLVFWFGNPPQMVRDQYTIVKLRTPLIPKRLRKLQIPTQDVISLITEFIANYPEDLVPVREIRDYLLSLGYSGSLVDKILSKKKLQRLGYPIYKHGRALFVAKSV